jgi:hypothetical protein
MPCSIVPRSKVRIRVNGGSVSGDLQKWLIGGRCVVEGKTCDHCCALALEIGHDMHDNLRFGRDYFLFF